MNNLQVNKLLRPSEAHVKYAVQMLISFWSQPDIKLRTERDGVCQRQDLVPQHSAKGCFFTNQCMVVLQLNYANVVFFI